MTGPWYCPVCSIHRRSLPCADCGACSGCCEAYQRPPSEAWLRAQGWSPEMYGPPAGRFQSSGPSLVELDAYGDYAPERHPFVPSKTADEE